MIPHLHTFSGPPVDQIQDVSWPALSVILVLSLCHKAHVGQPSSLWEGSSFLDEALFSLSPPTPIAKAAVAFSGIPQM